MIVGIEDFLKKPQRYMELAEKIDLYVVDRTQSVVWHIHCKSGSIWDRLADGLAGLLGESSFSQPPLQNRMIS